MGLPPKSYFHLTEVAERWSASIQDLACYTLDGLLEVAVMTIGTRVETGRFDVNDRGVFRVPEGEKVLNGPQPVVSSDLWPVFRTGAGRITRFKPHSAEGYVDLSEDIDPIAVTLQDLLVTRSERERFERFHGLDADKSGDPPLERPPEQCSFLQRNNYAEVVLNGEVFRLGLLQASIVRALHQASQSDNPWRHGKELLADSNAQTMRMVDILQDEAKLADAHRVGWTRLLSLELAGSANSSTITSRLPAIIRHQPAGRPSRHGQRNPKAFAA